jgi:hypothetical protein
MTKKQLKQLARRFSYDDWMDINRDGRSFGMEEVEVEEATLICQRILLERDGLAPCEAQ